MVLIPRHSCGLAQPIPTHASRSVAPDSCVVEMGWTTSRQQTCAPSGGPDEQSPSLCRSRFWSLCSSSLATSRENWWRKQRMMSWNPPGWPQLLMRVLRSYDTSLDPEKSTLSQRHEKLPKQHMFSGSCEIWNSLLQHGYNYCHGVLISLWSLGLATVRKRQCEFYSLLLLRVKEMSQSRVKLRRNR